MGLRPRTARRLALAGAIVFLIVLAAAVAFTLPKFQNRRQLESFQREGMLAHEEGRHGVAVQLLGRHLRGMGDRPVDPAIRLAFARSRAELEVSGGGHLPAAITVYRLYLQDAPEDRLATVELLQLYVKVGQWIEARELAGRLRPSNLDSTSADDVVVLRQEVIARLGINTSDPVIEQIEDRLLAQEPLPFVDFWRAYTRALTVNNHARADSVFSLYRESDPSSLGVRALAAVIGSEGLPLDDAARALADVIGLDAQTGQSTEDVAFEDDELTRALASLVINSWRQEPLLFGILDRAIKSSNDADLARQLVRRRYWAGLGDDVISQPTTTPNGRIIADVLGYAAMVKMDRGEADSIQPILDQISSVTDDFRATGWSLLLQARQHMEAGKLIEARVSASKAIEAYPFEPTFRFVLGDIHDRMGRLTEASDAWAQASELAGPGVWTAPQRQRVLSLLRANRSTEAGAAARELVATVRASGSRRTAIEAAILQAQVNARLAVVGQLEIEAARESMRFARGFKDAVTGPLRVESMLQLASFEATIGNFESARAELREALQEELTEQQSASAEEIDLAFGLGVLSSAGEITLDPPPQTPSVAIRTILVYVDASGSEAEQANRIRESMEFLAQRITSADTGTRSAWLRADAIVKSQFGHETADTAWKLLVAAAPDDVEILTEAMESIPLVYDRGFVESGITRVVELTATQGRTLPSRLRLVRARSIFGREPTLQSRDEALIIVRGVVVTEPENVTARTILGNILRHPRPPGVPEAAWSERDNLAAAVEQFRAASRLVGGRAAIGYLLEAASMSYRAGNESLTRQVLSELVAQSRITPIARGVLARDLAKFGDFQTSSRIIEEMFAEDRELAEMADDADKPELGLFLAQLYLGSNENVRAVAVLDRIIESDPVLTRTQLGDVVSRFMQAGRTDRADQVLGNVARFGLAPQDADRVRAQQAVLAGDLSGAAEVLTRIVEANRNDASAWVALVDVMFRSGDSDGATSRVEEALQLHPDNQDLLFWRQMVSGNLAEALMMRASDGPQSRSVRLAVERVEAYESKKLSLDRDARLSELRSLRGSFSGNAPVLKYVFRERSELGDDPAALADDAIADHRRFVDDEELLRFAAFASLRGARYDDAMRLATRLRGLTRGSTIESDLIFAQAAQAAGNHAGVVDRLASAIDAAIADPTKVEHRQVIILYSTSAIQTGGETGIRNRLEQVARTSSEFRSQIWIPLAATSVSPAQRAEAWMRAAEQMGLVGMEVLAIEAWLALSERFPDRAEQFTANATRIALPHVAVFPDDLGAVAIAGLASQRRAEALPFETASESFAQAEEFFVRASNIQPENPNFLFTAALCADAAGRPGPAEQYYRTLMNGFAGNDLFTAAIRNNLAGLLTRENPSPARLSEALLLANQAVGFDNIAAFFGTRGWIHLAQAAHGPAESDFRRAAELDSSSAEGWLGLAAVYKQSGREVAEWTAALDRARALSGSGGLARELSTKARMYGLDK